MRVRWGWVIGFLGGWAPLIAVGADGPPLGAYFQAETARLAARPLRGIASAEDWKAARPELQRQLREMLGLDPWPGRGDLHAEVRRTVERPDFVVETILYQSSPGLYVTGNLYRPRAMEGRLPAVLYVCGHSKVEKDGVIYGCKTHYQHHAAWYAANGYVCLVLDTLQLGEIPGLHHGTYREGMWWWQSRGYTPAGVEAWNAIRGIDYLCTRPEVDPARIGVTGRSGGGATSWWVGALDDRVAAVVPVAGITDLTNHVVDGVIEGHCDCMYPVNTYRWDFPTLAALVAPKPLLVENTDKDPIFPEDGVRRIYPQLESVYGWYSDSDRLGLVIGKGGHVDSEEVRHPSFAFMDRWLKGVDRPIEEPDRAVPIEELKVLGPGEVPPGSKNATIHETFVPRVEAPPVPESAEEWEALRARWMKDLRMKVFAGWPGEQETVPLDVQVALDLTRGGVRLRAIDATSQPGVRLRLWVLTHVGPGADGPPREIAAGVVDESAWREEWSWLLDPTKAESFDRPLKDGDRDLDLIRSAFAVHGRDVAVIVPRGVGPSAWDPKKDVHVRRRFALLGQTLAGMQVWDVRRALAALHALPDFAARRVVLLGKGQAAPLALWAAVFEPEVGAVLLEGLPASVREGPALLNLDRILGPPQALALMHPRRVVLFPDADGPTSWSWPRALAARLSDNRPGGGFLHVEGEDGREEDARADPR